MPPHWLNIVAEISLSLGPTYWLMMQIAMLIGYCAGAPMNGWLIRKGWKEAM